MYSSDYHPFFITRFRYVFLESILISIIIQMNGQQYK